MVFAILLASTLSLIFFSNRPIFLKLLKKVRQFIHNVQKYRLVNTVTVNFMINIMGHN